MTFNLAHYPKTKRALWWNQALFLFRRHCPRHRFQTFDSCEGEDVTSSEIGSVSGSAGAVSVAVVEVPAANRGSSSSEVANAAGGSEAAASMGAAYRVRLVVPSGVGLGGRTVDLFSTSRCAISCSICALNSFEARLNSLRYLPTWRAISGNFLGPKMMRAKKNRKIVSEKLMRFIILPGKEKQQSPARPGANNLALTTFLMERAPLMMLPLCDSGLPGAVKFQFVNN